jgi:hypothetical protein
MERTEKNPLLSFVDSLQIRRKLPIAVMLKCRQLRRQGLIQGTFFGLLASERMVLFAFLVLAVTV